MPVLLVNVPALPPASASASLMPLTSGPVCAEEAPCSGRLEYISIVEPLDEPPLEPPEPPELLLLLLLLLLLPQALKARIEPMISPPRHALPRCLIDVLLIRCRAGLSTARCGHTNDALGL